MRRRRVLVAGVNGRIGRRLAPALIAQGSLVVGIARNSPPKNMSIIQGDLSDYSVMERAFLVLQRGEGESLAPTTVVHLAGMADASEASLNPNRAFQVNVGLTQKLLEYSGRKGVEHFIFASTGYVYGLTGTLPANEDSPVHPESVYATTKLAAESLVRDHASKYGLKADILRISNVYGPDSPPSTVVGRILQLARERNPILVRSREPVRDFIYIDDVVNAIVKLIEFARGDGCRVYNVSSGIGTSIGCLVDTIEAIERGTQPDFSDAGSEDRLVLCNDALKAQTTWCPQYSLADGLRACLA
jgi:nucleoside-diphosphate-sugar epimerase